MNTRINLELLTQQSVTVMTTRVFEDNGQEFATPPHAKAYVNSAEDRKHLKAELPEPFLSAVLAIWGDAPTVFFEDEEAAG